MEKLKAAAQAQIKTKQDSLIEISHRIHAYPELGFEEEKACGWLAEMLDGAGFKVQTGICELPTAFVASFGSGPLHIAICAEYDALPGIGHACGHNMIAAMAVGAAMSVAKIADEVGLTVSVLGTPAEENGGGKVLMLERGAFDGVHAAMMVHPGPLPFDLIEPTLVAISSFEARYTGKEAHAGSAPEYGINALDALTVAQTAIGLLRQHTRPGDRIHGIITKGGDAPNVIPAHTEAWYNVRALNIEGLNQLQPRVERCFEAGALATGAKLELVAKSPTYTEVRHDAALAAFYRQNVVALGRPVGEYTEGAGSTDMGNISLALPAIHPALGLNCLPALNHQPEFTAYCATPNADHALLDGATAMAWTALDIAVDKALSQRLLAKTS
jgi:amidohydrolase